MWHPLDHVSVRCVRCAPDGSIGPGAQIEAIEFLGRNPHDNVDGVATIEQLDEEGFSTTVAIGGFPLARLEHTFRQTAAGTHVEHSLIVLGRWRFGLLGKLVVALRFSQAEGEVWLKHGIEEMGALPHFLPQLYECERQRGERRSDVSTSRGEDKS